MSSSSKPTKSFRVLATRLAAAALVVIAVGVVPVKAGPDAAGMVLNGPETTLRLVPMGTKDSPFPALSEATSMLLVGGALMGFGLVGRKRRAEAAGERR